MVENIFMATTYSVALLILEAIKYCFSTIFISWVDNK